MLLCCSVFVIFNHIVTFLFQDQLQRKNKQPIKLSSSLKKLTNLDLTKENKMLMKISIFYKLSKVENSKESYSTLISALCKLYHLKKPRFVFNSKASFHFLSKRSQMFLVSKIPRLIIPMLKGKNFSLLCMTLKISLLVTIAKHSKHHILRKSRKICRQIIDDEHTKLYFKQLMCYLYRQQGLYFQSGLYRHQGIYVVGIIWTVEVITSLSNLCSVLTIICSFNLLCYL